MKLPPIRTIILIGLALRLVAAIYSQGYAMHDDHFVIEDGPYQWFLPDHGGWFHRAEPPGHSVVYPSIIYAILSTCMNVGITDPQSQMLVMRILHALFATLAIPLAAAIARRVGSERSAQFAALLVAVFWVFPFMSVRNLIEMMCIPPLMAGVFLVLRRASTRDLVLAGLAFAAAFMFRYHTAIIPATMVIVLAWQRQWRVASILAVACLVSVALTQGVIDLAVWGSFMAAPISYVKSNLAGVNDYTSGPFYQYVVLIIGILIPPLSLVLLWRVITDNRPALRWEMVTPIAMFILAHSLIANKQERFILPIVPLLLVAVAVAWVDRPSNVMRTSVWTRGAWTFFWVANSVLLILFTFSYSKRSRVEALTYLSHQPNVERVAVIGDNIQAPSFYLYPRLPLITVSSDTTSDTWSRLATFHPSHVVFFDLASRDAFLRRTETVVGRPLRHCTDIEPGLLDATLHTLNPSGNKNQTSVVYSVEK